MPVVLGRREHGFDDPIGLLSDCHRRIERFLHTLVTLAEIEQGGGLSEEQQAILERALNYFREAAPKHTADEEESLFPRLQSSAGFPKIAARIASLQDDHREASALHERVDRLGRGWLDANSLSSSDTAMLRRSLAQLSLIYTSHIAIEDRELFPVAAQLLTREEKAGVGREMAARRASFATVTGSLW